MHSHVEGGDVKEGTEGDSREQGCVSQECGLTLSP